MNLELKGPPTWNLAKSFGQVFSDVMDVPGPESHKPKVMT
jgi:hypothetical protein